MSFEDGTQYNLIAMRDTLIGGLMGYMEATGAVDLREVFQEFVI
jgi:hypothetical protein